MKDLLKRKPSFAELSGISKSRLDSFATKLSAFLGESMVGSSHHPSTPSSNFTVRCDNAFEDSYSSSTPKILPSQHSGGQAPEGNAILYQVSLSPNSTCFKETLPGNLSSLRSNAVDKIKCHGDSHQSAVDKLTNDSGSIKDSSSIHSDSGETPEVTKNCSFPPCFLGSQGRLTVPLSPASGAEIPQVVSPLFSPYYCWCPPGISTLPSLAALSQSPDTSVESPPLPSGALLLPNTLPASLLEPVRPLNLSTVMDFPPFLPDPLLVRMSMPTSQQIPTFTPLMCDPIVHVPVIDMCSSGQGCYLVSAGPALSTSIPPLHPRLVKPLIPESDPVVKGARETLRLLMSGSSQGNQQVTMDTLPAILVAGSDGLYSVRDTNPDEKQNSILVAGSHGLYSGTIIANSIAAMGLVSLSEQAVKKPGDSGGSFSESEDMPSLDSKVEE
ncbi:hypothetical protein RIF29_00275 [Crotalaria pallida]|uniref:Uncharacterized protein n=1 Tax=Crotalaria pallida TaxID=3830 RepID=A0AAN9IW09_CROPI